MAKTKARVIASPPGFIRPMLASPLPVGKKISDYTQGWIAEEKYDGIRLCLLVENRQVWAWSRWGLSRDPLPTHIYEAATELFDGYYDGELLSRLGGTASEVPPGSNTGKELLALFDTLHMAGGSLLPQPAPGQKTLTGPSYAMRRQYLDAAIGALPEDSPIFAPEQWPANDATLAKIWDMENREGLILKDVESDYRVGQRSLSWLKIKRLADADVTILGFVAGESGPYSIARVAGADGIETTVRVPTAEMRREVAANPAKFINSAIEISFQERTKDGSYRSPRWSHRVGADS